MRCDVDGQVLLDRDHLSDASSGAEQEMLGDEAAALAPAALASASAARSIDLIIQLAEKYFDRIDAVQVMELLPPQTPLSRLLGYFSKVLEFGETKKRNLQVKTSCTMALLLC